jgi:aspartate-semialdehyde dehydrogenase
MAGLNVAIMGATGAVGQEMLKTVEQRDFPVNSLRLLASARSIGRQYTFKGQTLEVEELSEASFEGLDLVLASAGGSISKKFAPFAVKSGAVVVDNTSAFRMDPEVPLVVPEVNAHAIAQHKGIIANPNCSTIQMVVALKPIYDAVGIERIVVSTYQAISGAGAKAVEEFQLQAKAVLEGKEYAPKVFPHQIAFNCLPQIPQSNAFGENRYTSEEMKMVNETRKIMEDSNIRVSATCVRVPVITGHSESINITTKKKITVEEAFRLLENAPGIELLDDLDAQKYPLATIAEGRDETFVGRIREDISQDMGLDLWVVSDNLRKGAALNAVQIAEEMIKMDLLKMWTP